MRSLPAQTAVFAGSETTPVARTTYEYDYYPNGLTNRANLSGHDSTFTTSKLTRGNVTGITQWLLPSTQYVTRMQYDIAGNVVSRTDPRGYTSSFYYDDGFGSPDGEATSNTAPLDLQGQSAFGFVTRQTDPLGHSTYTQFDYNIGKPVDTQDANTNVTSLHYDDPYDRLTLVRFPQVPVGSNSYHPTTAYTYNDSDLNVVTAQDLNTNDGAIQNKTVYDGLGRVI